jgi:phosphohistidine phosphatase
MITLILFRHAKSSWDDPAVEDFDRPLAARGRNAAPKMAAHLAEQGLLPDLILCSASLRTRQTLALALPAFAPVPQVDYAEALYDASVATLLAIVRDAPANARKLMVIGHNPGLQSFANYLIGQGEPAVRRALAGKFPTAGIAAITFEAESWSGLQPGAGRLELFATPKRLG